MSNYTQKVFETLQNMIRSDDELKCLKRVPLLKMLGRDKEKIKIRYEQKIKELRKRKGEYDTKIKYSFKFKNRKCDFIHFRSPIGNSILLLIMMIEHLISCSKVYKFNLSSNEWVCIKTCESIFKVVER